MDALKSFIGSLVPMSDEDFLYLENMMLVMRVKKGDYLLEQGQVCRYIYFVKKGFFRMYYLDFKGNQINYRFTDENNFLTDYQSFLTRKPSRYFWQAMQDAELFAFKYTDIQTAYAHSQAWERLGRLIAEQVYQQVNERIEMMQFLTPEKRYQFLLDTRPELFGQVSQFHLSSYLGIKPESLSRIRKRLLRK